MDLTTTLIAAISTLAGVVVFLYTQALENHKACALRERECQAKYEGLLERVVKVETEREVFERIERRIAATYVVAAKAGELERRSATG